MRFHGVLMAGLAAASPPGPESDLAYLLRAANRPLTGTCEAEWRPDRAVVPGAVSATAVQPTEARDVLDRQIGLMRAFVTAKGGALVLGERTRAVRGGLRDAGRPDARPPFVMVQRLSAEAPAEADVDALLEGLLELGLDQFGLEVSLDPEARVHSSPQAAVRYRIGGLEQKLTDLRGQCRDRAFLAWCETTVASEAVEGCAAALRRSASRFAVRSFEVGSAMALRAEGGLAALTLAGAPVEARHLAGRGLEAREFVDLLGLVPLPVHASITVELVVGP